jgi:hypothetical protein
MSDPNVRVEWVRAPDMAEVAEALGVPTTQVLLVGPTPQEGTLLVVYNPEPDGALHSVLMRRNSRDGILRRRSKPREHVGLWEDIEREIKEQLGE